MTLFVDFCAEDDWDFMETPRFIKIVSIAACALPQSLILDALKVIFIRL